MKNADRPAMPVPLNVGEGFVECGNADGLTKRGMMAMAVMQGLLSRPSGYTDFKGMAKDAARMADAMLAELEATKGNQ